MEVSVEIDEDLLGEIDRAAHVQNITRSAAFMGALITWVAQARRDAVICELFEMEFDPDLVRTDSDCGRSVLCESGAGNGIPGDHKASY